MQFEMCDVPGDEDEIEWAFAADLVGDVDVAALCVLNVRDIHADSVRPILSFVQRRGGGRLGLVERANTIEDMEGERLIRPDLAMLLSSGYPVLSTSAVSQR
jgi:hypothetical protein